MSFLRKIFGPSKAEIWSQLANDIGGEYIDGGFWEGDGVRYQHDEWEIVMDTFTQSSGTGDNRSSDTYTRIRAPFVNKDDFHFEIYHSSIFSGIARFFGGQDVEIGIPVFDRDFDLKSNDPEKLKLLLNDKSLIALIYQNPRVHFKIDTGEGWLWNTYPDGINTLYFESYGTLTDMGQLKALFEMFSSTLERLVQIDSAYDNDPRISLKI